MEPVPGDRDRAGQDTGCGQSGWQGNGGNREQVWGSACSTAHAREPGEPPGIQDNPIPCVPHPQVSQLSRHFNIRPFSLRKPTPD